MQQMSDAAARGDRSVVYETPQFIDYFRAATPEVELGDINIGSRPARRGGGKSGVESLRAIPWQFAWTRTACSSPPGSASTTPCSPPMRRCSPR